MKRMLYGVTALAVFGNEDEARFSSIMGIAVNSKNELYVSDYGNSLIRKVVIELVPALLLQSAAAMLAGRIFY